jgi:hypothetical protein
LAHLFGQRERDREKGDGVRSAACLERERERGEEITEKPI